MGTPPARRRDHRNRRIAADSRKRKISSVRQNDRLASLIRRVSYPAARIRAFVTARSKLDKQHTPHESSHHPRESLQPSSPLRCLACTSSQSLTSRAFVTAKRVTASVTATTILCVEGGAELGVRPGGKRRGKCGAQLVCPLVPQGYPFLVAGRAHGGWGQSPRWLHEKKRSESHCVHRFKTSSASPSALCKVERARRKSILKRVTPLRAQWIDPHRSCTGGGRERLQEGTSAAAPDVVSDGCVTWVGCGVLWRLTVLVRPWPNPKSNAGPPAKRRLPARAASIEVVCKWCGMAGAGLACCCKAEGTPIALHTCRGVYRPGRLTVLWSPN